MSFVILYIFIHLFSVSILLKEKWKKIYAFSILITLIVIYSFKPDTYDIKNYAAAVNYPYFEPLFMFLILLFRTVFQPRIVILIIQLLIFITTLFVLKKLSKQKGIITEEIIYYGIALISPAFTLGINNALRQFWASVLIIYGLYLFFNKKFFSGTFIFIVSFLIHYSSVAFTFLGLLVLLIQNKLFSKGFYFGTFYRKAQKKFVISTNLLITIILVISIIGFALFPIIISSTNYAVYLNFAIFEGRQPLYLKYAYILTTFLISQFFIQTNDFRKFDFFNFLLLLRLFLIVFLLPFNISSSFFEAGSRIIFFYFVIEMFLISIAFKRKYYYFVVSLVFLNAFTTNVWNILGL